MEKACHWTGNWAAGSENGTLVYNDNSPVGWTDYVAQCQSSIDPDILKVSVRGVSPIYSLHVALVSYSAVFFRYRCD